jgi:hypothetical protein
MSTFTLRGRRGGETVEITWTDGKLSGDPDAVAMVERIAQGAEGHVVSSLTDSTTHDHLSNPSVAGSLMRMVFPGNPECINSDLEPFPPLPEGAIE